MTPREEFEIDLRKLCGAMLQHASVGLNADVINQDFNKMIEKWAPKNDTKDPVV